MRIALAALALVGALATTVMPAAAKSLTAQQFGTIFCFARLAGDMAPVMGLLDADLAKLVDAQIAKGGEDSVQWQGKSDYANDCAMMGASGTYDFPEIVLFYSYRDAGHTSYSDKLVVHFVDDRIRLYDIKFADGTTLRQKLGATP